MNSSFSLFSRVSLTALIVLLAQKHWETLITRTALKMAGSHDQLPIWRLAVHVARQVKIEHQKEKDDGLNTCAWILL